jgi:hypothetical protein
MSHFKQVTKKINNYTSIRQRSLSTDVTSMTVSPRSSALENKNLQLTHGSWVTILVVNSPDLIRGHIVLINSATTVIVMTLPSPRIVAKTAKGTVSAQSPILCLGFVEGACVATCRQNLSICSECIGSFVVRRRLSSRDNRIVVTAVGNALFSPRTDDRNWILDLLHMSS